MYSARAAENGMLLLRAVTSPLLFRPRTQRVAHAAGLECSRQLQARKPERSTAVWARRPAGAKQPDASKDALPQEVRPCSPQVRALSTNCRVYSFELSAAAHAAFGRA
jgi:hypothetical protein